MEECFIYGLEDSILPICQLSQNWSLQTRVKSQEVFLVVAFQKFEKLIQSFERTKTLLEKEEEEVRPVLSGSKTC